MKKFFSLFIALVMMLSIIPAMAQENILVTLNGEDAVFSPAVIRKGDTLYVPLRLWSLLQAGTMTQDVPRQQAALLM